MRPRLVFTLLVITTAASSSPAFATDEVLKEVRATNRASVQSIRTFYCRISISSNPEPAIRLPSGEHWRSHEAARSKWSSEVPKGVFECVLRNGVVSALVPQARNQGEPRLVGTIVPHAHHPLGPCDPWVHGKLVLPGPEPASVFTFDELLAKPHRIHRVKRERDDAAECVVVDFEHRLSRFEVWFDRNVGCLIRKVTQTPVPGSGDDTTWKAESRVTRFVEAAQGVYFPAEVEFKYFRGEKQMYVQRISFAELRVNQPLPKTAFTLQFPAGTVILDEVKGKRYRTGADGLPAGAMQELVRGKVLPKGEESRTETKHEPTSWISWVLPASIVALALAACIKLVSRHRAASRSEGTP